MRPKIIALGEVLVEVMRKGIDQHLSKAGEFLGPFPSGAPAIFIDAAARLGVSTGFIGVIGADDFGECITNRLSADNVDTTYMRTTPRLTTGIAFVAYHKDGTRKFIFHLAESAAAQLNQDDVHQEYLSFVKFVHITGSSLFISENARQACYRAVQLCKKAGGQVSFDPNVRPELGFDQIHEIFEPILKGCDVLLPSETEATFLTGEEDERSACRSLVDQGIPIVALKQGKRGSTIFTISEIIESQPLEVEEVDPTGAGDCYAAGFVVGLLEGWDLAHVARFANVVGALSVTRQGPMEGAPTREDVLNQL